MLKQRSGLVSDVAKKEFEGMKDKEETQRKNKNKMAERFGYFLFLAIIVCAEDT